MSTTLSIGDFSLMTHLSIKTLRYYHQVGLLEPAEVNPHTGYRSYGVEQLPTAQIIQRFRDLGMPIDAVKAVLAAPDLDTRNALIATQVGRLEGELAQTQQAVQSLRNLLEPAHASISVEQRTLPATQAVGIQDVVDRSDLVVWVQGALGELYAIIAAQGLQPSGPSGGLFASDLFHYERGEVTMFVPISGKMQTVGRVAPLVVPAAEVAVTVHDGSLANLTDTYGALGVYVATQALGVVGPVREYYLVDARATSDTTQWRTELAWPIYQTAKPHSKPEG
jgi:DNA-binding transcriptional MerR regulator